MGYFWDTNIYWDEDYRWDEEVDVSLPNVPVQNHIHLSNVLRLDAEAAPDIWWKTTDRIQMSEVVASVKRTLTGKVLVYRLEDESGPIQYRNFKYTLKLDNYGNMTTQQRRDALFSMQGKLVYLVDHEHPNDGESHTPYIIPMLLVSVSPIEVFDPMLTRYYATVELTEIR